MQLLKDIEKENDLLVKTIEKAALLYENQYYFLQHINGQIKFYANDLQLTFLLTFK